MIAKELSQICNGGHRHVHLVSGRAKHAQVYPEDLCLAILRGLKSQLTNDKKLRPHEPLLQVCEESDTRFHELLNLSDDVEYMDDVTGKMLENNLVELAKTEEMQVFKEHDVYTCSY